MVKIVNKTQQQRFGDLKTSRTNQTLCNEKLPLVKRRFRKRIKGRPSIKMPITMTRNGTSTNKWIIFLLIAGCHKKKKEAKKKERKVNNS